MYGSYLFFTDACIFVLLFFLIDTITVIFMFTIKTLIFTDLY